MSENATATTESPALRRSRRFTLAAHLATLCLSFNWFAWVAPPERVPRALLLLILVLPLALTLRGVLNERPKAYVLTGLVAMWLFAAGLDIAFYVDGWRAGGWCLTALATALFIGCYRTLKLTPQPVPAPATGPTTDAD